MFTFCLVLQLSLQLLFGLGFPKDVVMNHSSIFRPRSRNVRCWFDVCEADLIS